MFRSEAEVVSSDDYDSISDDEYYPHCERSIANKSESRLPNKRGPRRVSAKLAHMEDISELESNEPTLQLLLEDSVQFLLTGKKGSTKTKIMAMTGAPPVIGIAPAVFNVNYAQVRL